ncbi:MAG TPA: NDP-sugar synthase [Spirochaetota bacterium]|nr:NDP-sugar synthase [Spirochaetota bacterium]
MKGFILAAGYGERLRPVSDIFPKPLVPVANVPSICYAISILVSAGIKEAVVNLHYRPEIIRSFFEERDNFGLKVSFSYEPKILGTGGGLMNCRKELEGDDFLLVNSDVVMDLDVASLVRRHRESSSPGTVVLYRAAGAASIGQAGVRDGRVVDFRNFLGTGVASGLVYTGAAVLSPSIFRYLEEGFSSIVYTGYTGLITRERLDFYEHEGLWLDIGSIGSLRRASLGLANTPLAKRAAAGCDFDASPVARGARVADDANVEASVIGEGCVVGSGARIVSSLLLPGSSVEAGARIENAVVLGGEVLKA